MFIYIFSSLYKSGTFSGVMSLCSVTITISSTEVLLWEYLYILGFVFEDTMLEFMGYILLN